MKRRTVVNLQTNGQLLLPTSTLGKQASRQAQDPSRNSDELAAFL